MSFLTAYRTFLLEVLLMHAAITLGSPNQVFRDPSATACHLPLDFLLEGIAATATRGGWYEEKKLF